MIDSTNLLDRVKSELEAQGGLSRLGSSFRIRKGFRYTDDSDFLIFLDRRARGGSRSTILCYTINLCIFWRRRTSCIPLSISYYRGVCIPFDWQEGHFVLNFMKDDYVFDTKHVHAYPKRLRLRKSVSPFSQNITNRRCRQATLWKARCSRLYPRWC